MSAFAAVLAATCSTTAETTTCGHVSLAASKSIYGHAEPAAGLVAISHAALALTSTTTPQLLHLRALNPSVATAMGVDTVAGHGPHGALLVAGRW